MTCLGIESEVLAFIAESVCEKSRTLETGAGCSTLVFALRRSEHIAITPNRSEIDLITAYAHEKEISLEKVHFVPKSSDRFLPHCERSSLDLVLIDGKHAFPWPIIDWFYTADMLLKGGLMIIDDARMRSVVSLAEFMQVDPGWEMIRKFSNKTLVFMKTRDVVHDVAWHMQPFMITTPSRLRILGRKLKSIVGD